MGVNVLLLCNGLVKEGVFCACEVTGIVSHLTDPISPLQTHWNFTEGKIAAICPLFTWFFHRKSGPTVFKTCTSWSPTVFKTCKSWGLYNIESSLLRFYNAKASLIRQDDNILHFSCIIMPRPHLSGKMTISLTYQTLGCQGLTSQVL